MEITEQVLKKEGFRKVFPDEVDKEYFFYKKRCPHNLLKDLHIIVDEKISIYCTELVANKPNKYGLHVMLMSFEPSTHNLLVALKWAKVGSISI